ncbi:hypothetical protein [Eleftheria terrae]|uniref:hypothetical protein n=1 Tax=Eleftheria terrae TaxID=1597781 RepID=UPI00263A6331|nr:hypothetical protein [Eleftheria terrae]WKB50526.1 hypothetical protein N7L95_00320 [Eleftheria terrae]
MLKHQLTAHAVSLRNDAVARFVGLAAYEAAGGVVTRDLFTDDEATYLTDVELLQRLAKERLERIAEPYRAEGWGWVEVRAARVGYAEASGFGTIPAKRRSMTPEEQAELDRLEAAQQEARDALERAYEQDTCSDEDEERLQRSVEEAEERLDTFVHALDTYDDVAKAGAGVLISIDYDGTPEIRCGLVRPEDRGSSRGGITGAARTGQDNTPHAAGLSSALMRRLTAHRTAALQAAMIRNPHVALAALAHRMVTRLMSEHAGYWHPSAVNVGVTSCASKLRQYADNIEENPAWTAVLAKEAEWRAKVPKQGIFAWLVSLPTDDLLNLIAFCTAFATDATSESEGWGNAHSLAWAAPLDMAECWEPSAANYLTHVPKARILETVAEAVSAEAAAKLSHLKKADLVDRAAALLAGCRWLPPALRTPSGPPAPEDCDEEDDDEASATHAAEVRRLVDPSRGFYLKDELQPISDKLARRLVEARTERSQSTRTKLAFGAPNKHKEECK